ncbi:MAG TPA: hypothetical protein VJ483_07070 [Holophagaceae bacterium]|nr:hypothetical protein [Holophagaceae bacterium]
MKKLIALAFVSAFAFTVQAGEKKEAKTNEACKTQCKMTDDKCPDKCMKACAERAAKQKTEKK